jgi:hypothetical protein
MSWRYPSIGLIKFMATVRSISGVTDSFRELARPGVTPRIISNLPESW